MSSYLRPRLPGACIFFTVALHRRGTDLLIREIETLRRVVGLTLQERPVQVDAWVVLPDHMHTVWTLPEGDSAYGRRWSVLKARFSREMPMGPRRDSHIRRREKTVWQRRFWEHHVRSATEKRELIRYCWTNPVKHGMWQAPEDWPYSSYHRDQRNV